MANSRPVSSLKEKVSQVKIAGVKSYSSARGKLAPSPSTAKAKPPPPPPPREASWKQGGDIRTASSHTSSSDVPDVATDVDRIDWGNLSHQDKQVFFTWLDESFARYLDQPRTSVRITPVDGPGTSTPLPRSSPSLPPHRDSPQAGQNTGPDHLDVIPGTPAVGRRNLPSVLSQRGPINLSTRPPAPSESPMPHHPNSRPSYPVADLQISFPPPAENGPAAADLAYSDGHTKMARGVMLFSDLRDVRQQRRATQTHGAAVAAFAGRTEALGRPVARRDCWDIAHEALLHAATLYTPNDAPVLSDVVEWRSVRIGAAHFGVFAILGDPDHTADLIEDTVPRCAVADGEGVRLADIGVLMVVEQTAGPVPRRESYDLAKLLEGEVWVYRPVGMVEYVGSTLSIDIPSGLDTYAL
ncbi:hypothetical protein EDB87DRAFT_1682587 [Lactarius vividus]|nr:hypothetical protein EDB87DRAFT_1682587 [Lactarius vividus]